MIISFVKYLDKLNKILIKLIRVNNINNTMKYTFAVACLISTSQAYLGEKVWGLKSTKGRAVEALVQAEYANYSTTQANGRPPY